MGKKLKIDFSNVQEYKRCEEGIHLAKLTKIDEGTSQAGDDMLKATFEVIKGSSKGARVFDNFVLTDKALWKFKMCLSAMGVKCDGKIAIDLDKLVGKTVNVEVGYEEYNGQKRARILDYTKIVVDTDDDDDFDEDEEAETEDIPFEEVEEEKPKKNKKAPEPVEDDEDDEDWEDA